MSYSHFLEVVFQDEFPVTEENNVLTRIHEIIADQPKTYVIQDSYNITFTWIPWAHDNLIKYHMHCGIYGDLAVRLHSRKLEAELKRKINNHNSLWSITISKPLTKKVALEPEFLRFNQLHGGNL